MTAQLPCLAIGSSAQSDVWKEGYAPALSKVLQISLREVSELNVCHRLAREEMLSNADLERIRDCSYVIVDLDDSQCAAFVLGLALAHRKPLILLAPQARHSELSIAGVRPRHYDDPRAVRDYLLQIVAYWHSQSQLSASRIDIADFPTRCGFPLAILEGDGRYEYAIDPKTGNRSIFLSHTATEFVPPEPWRSEFRTVLDRQIEYAKNTGAVFFNGDLVRVDDYTPIRDERHGTRGIRIATEATDYYTFTSSNHLADFASVELADRLQRLEQPRLRSLRESVLANPLVVAVSVILRHEGQEWLLIQRRNQGKNFHGKQDFVCGATGMVSATRDLRSGEIDVYATAANELREETGIQVSDDRVRFLALARQTNLREIGLLAEVTLDRDPQTAIGPRADTFENEGFVTVAATPEALARFVADNGPPSRFSPLSVGALLFSLLRRYSRDRVEQAFVEAGVAGHLPADAASPR